MRRLSLLTAIVMFVSVIDTEAQSPITPANHSQCDPKIVVNPTNAKNLVAAAIVNDATIGAYASFDGGWTWSGSDAVSGSGTFSDPVLSFDPDGKAYLVYMTSNPGTQIILRTSSDGGINWSSAINVRQINVGEENALDRPWLGVSPKRNVNGVYNVYVSFTVFPTSGQATVELRKATNQALSDFPNWSYQSLLQPLTRLSTRAPAWP